MMNSSSQRGETNATRTLSTTGANAARHVNACLSARVCIGQGARVQRRFIPALSISHRSRAEHQRRDVSQLTSTIGIPLVMLR